MPLLKRLKSKYETLEEEWEEVNEKLRWFKKEIIKKADLETQYELYKRIEEYQTKVKVIEEEIEELEEKIDQSKQIGKSNLEECQTFDLLYKSLLKLGYWEQHNCFEEIAAKYSHGAFLIQGFSKNYGQRWLLKRLALISPKILEGKKIIIDLNRKSSKTDILAVWDEFAGRVGLSESTSPYRIAEKICELWKSQNVLIVFENVDETIKDNLCDLLNDFWESLTQKMLEQNNQQSIFKLFIFFLDYQAFVSQWDVGFVKEYNLDWQPKYPLELPIINRFLKQDIRNWLNYQSDFLPPAISENKTEIVKMLLEKQGIPIPTLRKICELCGCNWFDQEEKWLSL